MPSVRRIPQLPEMFISIVILVKRNLLKFRESRERGKERGNLEASLVFRTMICNQWLYDMFQKQQVKDREGLWSQNLYLHMAPHPSKWSYIFHMYSSENNAPRSQDYSARFHRDMSIMRVLKSRPPRPQPCLPNSQSAVPQSKNFKIHKMGTYSWNPILPDVEFNARITTRKTWKFYDLDST